ncbi:Transcription repressor of multidrug efflux pump acrAB operon, TetR (AcrR) family [Rhodovulum sp. PH10]|uniref:TetR family transcriptional regulator n=1 Tax=Rhodovulum sp. PH10 TaxID=1187851 RepID=UPI00027C1F7B|nr:TetR family transcriptional regulator [Rhodovulum sp. PH10]EJW13500.1 Transcription repressor of multidrug efflux pump acrAB operon, TetR (AcrR) family [Rhodovulum sp. PH10]
MRRTKQGAEETRDCILAVAERLFLEHGVVEVSLEQIACAAGFTRGAVHWHFQNKQGLLLALLDRMGGPLAELESQLEVDETLDPLEELLATTAAKLSDLQMDPKRKRLASYLVNFAMVEAPERQHDFDRRLRSSLRAIFRQAEKRGRLAPHWQPETAALAFCGMMHGLVHQWLTGETEFDVAGDVAAAMRAFVISLSAGKPPG